VSFSAGALKTKATLMRDLSFYLLEWRDAFRAFDWAKEYPNPQYHLEQINNLLALT